MNTSSISVPLLYKWTEPADGNAQQSLQAFVMQLSEYLLLRAFLFFLLRKHYVLIPESAAAPATPESPSTAAENPSATPRRSHPSRYRPSRSRRRKRRR